MNLHRHLNQLRKAALAFVVGLASACSLPAATVPGNFYVSTTGNDTNTCLSAARACGTVIGAIGKATVGSTIIIGAGTFVQSAQILVNKNLVLRGSGRDTTILRAPAGRTVALYVNAVQVRLQDLTVTGATAPNYAVQISGGANVVMERVAIRDNLGVGVWSDNSTLTMLDCLVQGNEQGLLNHEGILQISNTVFRLNRNTTLSNTGTASLDRVSMSENGPAGGSGLLPTLIDNQMTAGGSTGGPGVLSITNSTLENNNVSAVLVNSRGRVTVGATTVGHNQAAGLVNYDGALTISGSVLAQNAFGVRSQDTAAPVDTVLEVVQSVIFFNTGLGVAVNGGGAQLTNITVSSNGQGGIQLGGRGNITLRYGTVANNMIFGVNIASGDLVSQNSIIALNAPGQDCTGAYSVLTDGTTNLICDASLRARVGLGPLVPEGGTFIHPLQAGSPALDAARGDCPSTDQRGYARPFGSYCDIGAYELGAGLHLEAATPEPETATVTLPILEIVTDTPTSAPGKVAFVLTKNGNCRHGPGSVYPVLTSLTAGQSAEVLGRNEDGSWLYALIPGDYRCWMLASSGTPTGDVMFLAVVPAPPTPTPSVTPKPGGGAADSDGDGYTSDKDCDDKSAKINPGALETPGDGVDSNCNGKDDS